jgi:hypothetical protein
MAASDEGKNAQRKSDPAPCPSADGSKIHNGSHVFVFCARTTMGWRGGKIAVSGYTNSPARGAVIFNL